MPPVLIAYDRDVWGPPSLTTMAWLEPLVSMEVRKDVWLVAESRVDRLQPLVDDEQWLIVPLDQLQNVSTSNNEIRRWITEVLAQQLQTLVDHADLHKNAEIPDLHLPELS